MGSGIKIDTSCLGVPSDKSELVNSPMVCRVQGINMDTSNNSVEIAVVVGVIEKGGTICKGSPIRTPTYPIQG